jgi:hypothetical protein
VKTLDKKLWRDLAHMKGQAITISLVLACGVAALVAALTTYDSLQWSQQTYYEAAHFPHVFVSLKRAPVALTTHMAALAGVIDIEPRVVFDVMLDVPGVAAPPIGRMIALPEHGVPRMNQLHLRQGRWVAPGQGNEVLVSEGFARAHQLRPGGRVRALLNGKYQVFEIAGVVLTPEYIFAIRSGGLLPDDRQFGVFWTAHTTLAAAFNMEGAFNDVVLRLAPGTHVPDARHCPTAALRSGSGRQGQPRVWGEYSLCLVAPGNGESGPISCQGTLRALRQTMCSQRGHFVLLQDILSHRLFSLLSYRPMAVLLDRGAPARRDTARRRCAA